MEWLEEEIQAWIWVIFGIGMMLVSMAIIDLFIGITERIRGKKDDTN
jgi:hypothetical protein